MGKPVIKGTRIKVEFILEKLEQEASVEYLLEAYPHLTKDDILECIRYARALVQNEAVDLEMAGA
jgi:uncharacterized protein (DUF433 family)